MEVRSWYRNGDLDAFRKFCTQNRRKLISVQLKDSSAVKGILYDHHFGSSEMAGVFILLTNAAIHPAFYALSDVESLHYLAPAALIQTGSIVLSKHALSPNGLTYLL
jgi:hypothetical protein